MNTSKHEIPERHDAGMTHEDARNMRRAYAAMIHAGISPKVICQRFGVSDPTLRKACRENDTPFLPDRPRGVMSGGISKSTYSILAQLMRGDQSGSEIARSVGVSRQYINEIKQKAIAAGIKVPCPEAVE